MPTPRPSCFAIFFSFSCFTSSSDLCSVDNSVITSVCSASNASAAPIFRSVLSSSEYSFSRFSKLVSVNRMVCRRELDSFSSSSNGFLSERISCINFSSVFHSFTLSISLSVSSILLSDSMLEYFSINSSSFSIRSVRSDSLTDNRVSVETGFFLPSSISSAAAIEPKTNASSADI